MAIFKCKMCGGSLEVEEGASYGICEYCGTKQTLPTSKDETLQNLFNRANVLRRKAEFDKSAEIYEKILQASETEAEAYWGLILCKYGVEYVEDPKTYKRVPTCHRASYDAVTADEDYRNAVKYADMFQKQIYEEEAAAIEKIQHGIIAVAQKEDPYDVFICYKDTDESGKRTPDSVIANDIYHQLTHEGFKVFYAAITLEDKLGTEYEPYIFSALNTAKVMLVIGTKPEYFNAVWVKNEWSRFLKIIKKDRKKLLIPCYRDMDPYELPEEFAHLQAQDMSKIGFINDIIRGIKKVIVKEKKPAGAQQAAPQAPVVYGANITALLKRGNMALEDREWEKADGFFEEVLNTDAECAEAYFGKFLAKSRESNQAAYFSSLDRKYKAVKMERLTACEEDTHHISIMASKNEVPGYLSSSSIREMYAYDRGYSSALSWRTKQKQDLQTELRSDRLFTRAQRYAKGDFAGKLEKDVSDLVNAVDNRVELAKQQDQNNIEKVKAAYADHLKKTDDKVERLHENAVNNKEKDLQEKYQSARSAMDQAQDIEAFGKAKLLFENLGDYENCSALAAQCQKEIDRLTEEQRREEARLAEIRRKEAEEKARKTKRMTAILAAVAAICVAAFLVVTKVIIPNNNYNAAVALMENGDYAGAIEAFEAMNGYKDSADKIDAIYSTVFGKEEYEAIKNIKVGDSYVFGKYEQDNNTSNGTEDIEWVVLDKNGTDLLLISKYALDCQQYHGTKTSITWEECQLRSWLNKTFMEAAFSAEETGRILSSSVKADKNPKYDTSPGNDTEDKVFLLSIPEAENYFSSDSARACKPTAYTKERGAYVTGDGACWWWLRMPGFLSFRAASVGRGGSLSYGGYYVDNAEACVRPALWIGPLWINP